MLGVRFTPEIDKDDEDSFSPTRVMVRLPRIRSQLPPAPSAVFGLESEDVLEAFVARKTVAGIGEGRARRKDVFHKPCGSEQE